MKNPKRILLAALFAAALIMPSCYSSTFVMGEGPQQGVMEKGKNNFFVLGLVPGKHVDPKQMSGGSTNYKVEVEQTFVDGLLNVITFGIYNPMTVTVTR